MEKKPGCHWPLFTLPGGVQEVNTVYSCRHTEARNYKVPCYVKLSEFHKGLLYSSMLVPSIPRLDRADCGCTFANLALRAILDGACAFNLCHTN